MMPNLTPLEARVIDTVFGRRDFSDATALKEVAEDAGVSEAMVVKIAKKLGFSGYRDFRANVAEYVRLPIAEMHEELSPDDTARRDHPEGVPAPRRRRWRKRWRSPTSGPSSAPPTSSTRRANATSTVSEARPRSPGTCRTRCCASACARTCSTTLI